MARAMPTASFLPAIKCSNCAVEVELSMMGDHICSISSQADHASQHPGDSNSVDRVPRGPSQRNRSFSRPGPPLRVDSSVANRLYLLPNELTPASSETVSPISGPYSRKSPSPMLQRHPAVHLTQGPPSPEYSNLDCAFPPFPISTSRSATPVPKTIPSNPRFDNDYVREHAEPYNQSRPTSPPSSRQSRARSVISSRSRNRSDTIGSRPDPAARPSTANGTRKPSLASLSGGPKAAREERPPLPSTTSFGNAGSLAAPKSRPAAFLGLGSESSQAGLSAEQAAQIRPLSPSRSQTFPMHNDDRMSGNGPNSFIARRPSQPSLMLATERPPLAPSTGSLRSLQAPGPIFRPYNPSNQNPPPQTQPDSQPPRSASRNSNPSLPGGRPYPVRNASRSNIRVDALLPAQPPSRDHDLGEDSQTPAGPQASNLTQHSIVRSSPPPGNQTLARKRSKKKHGSDASYVPLPDLALPPKPPMPSSQPESPTDPFCQQGRLSPIPRAAMNRSPFSTTSSSSGSSRTSSQNQSVRGLPSRRATGGGSRGQCRGCSQPILPGQKSISSKDGRLTGRYHKECFACHSCRGTFETADFYVHDDHPFCAEHYHALNGSLCNGCGRGIEGQYLESTNKNDKAPEKFHPQCLTCSSCRVSLHNDYFEWMGKVYCERDARQAAGLQIRSPSDAFPSPRPSPSPGSDRSNNPSLLGRSGGLPAGPRVGLRPPGPGQPPRPGNGFLSPFPTNSGARGRFPERRTTKLMVM